MSEAVVDLKGKLVRFALAFLLILIYMGLWAMPLALAVAFLDDDVLGFVILGILVVILPTFPFVVDRIAKWCFNFRGVGSPVTEADLRQQILEINYHDLPIVAKEKGKKIIVTWKYQDAKWWEVMSKHGATQSFELIIKLDAARHRATLIDVSRSLRWGIGPAKVRFGFSFFRGVNFGYSVGTAWGIKENFTLGKIYDYKFNSEEIHNPVMNTILKAGWDVRLGLF